MCGGTTLLGVCKEQMSDDRVGEPRVMLLAVQVSGSLGAWWASVGNKGVWNVTGHTNNMQASECDEHCNWSDQQVNTHVVVLGLCLLFNYAWPLADVLLVVWWGRSRC